MVEVEGVAEGGKRNEALNFIDASAAPLLKAAKNVARAVRE